MSDTSLERILEEAFQTVLRSNFPHTATAISRMGEALSRTESVDVPFSNPIDVSYSGTNEIHLENAVFDLSFSNIIPPQTQARTSHDMNVRNQLHDTHMLYQNYQENMRLYQNNISMMVRHLQSVGRNINGGGPITRQRSRNSGETELHNFPFYGIFPAGTGSPDSYDIPTINHFTSATEYCVYDRETMADTRSCPITLDEFQDNEQICRIKHCRHIFKSNALQNWFSRNAHCPVCRYDIRTPANLI